jgi:RNA polymerase sigma factor (sigma-70 family)
MNQKQKLAQLEAWCNREMYGLYNYVVYRVADQTAADEIVATVCERGLKRLHQYDPRRGSLTAWMFGIARNALNDHFRIRVRQGTEISLEALPAIQGRGDTPEEQIIQVERFEQVVLLLDHLTETEREIVGLRYGGELKYQEIAELMGLNIDHVGVLLHRALGKLRDVLNEKEAEHEPRQV